jgi:hypothetical protein
MKKISESEWNDFHARYVNAVLAQDTLVVETLQNELEQDLTLLGISIYLCMENMENQMPPNAFVFKNI